MQLSRVASQRIGLEQRVWVLKIWSWGIYFSTAASMNALGSSWELSLMLCLTQG